MGTSGGRRWRYCTAGRGTAAPEPSQAERDTARIRWEQTVGEKYDALVRVALRRVVQGFYLVFAR
jgi:hypothetical protein